MVIRQDASISTGRSSCGVGYDESCERQRFTSLCTKAGLRCRLRPLLGGSRILAPHALRRHLAASCSDQYLEGRGTSHPRATKLPIGHKVVSSRTVYPTSWPVCRRGSTDAVPRIHLSLQRREVAQVNDRQQPSIITPPMVTIMV